jgi:hypothetical protein
VGLLRRLEQALELDGAWQNIGQFATSGPDGRYTVVGLSNWFYYQVRAYTVVGRCGIGMALPIYDGWGQPLWATGGARGSNVYVSHTGYFYC